MNATLEVQFSITYYFLKPLTQKDNEFIVDLTDVILLETLKYTVSLFKKMRTKKVFLDRLKVQKTLHAFTLKIDMMMDQYRNDPEISEKHKKLIINLLKVLQVKVDEGFFDNVVVRAKTLELVSQKILRYFYKQENFFIHFLVC